VRRPVSLRHERADEADGLAELGDFFAAAAAVRRLRSARIGRIGYPFPGMGDFAVDTTHLAATLGCAWTSLAVEDYIKRSAAADAIKASELVAEYRRSYDVAADVTDADLAVTARAELALRGLVKDHRLDALTYQFLAFGTTNGPRRCRSWPRAASWLRRGLRRRRGSDRCRGDHVPQLAKSAGDFLGDVHDRLRRRKPVHEPHG